MENKIMSLFDRLDSTTYNHSIRVMAIASEIEKYLSLDNNYLSNAALLHDIGKIYVPSVILDKVTRLNDIEREIINLHPYMGYKILKSFGMNEDINRIVLFHHGFNPPTIQYVEEYNNAEVMELAKLLHSIDVFEALTSDRPYHRGVSAIEALRIMESEGKHHPDVLSYIFDVLNGNINGVSAVHRFPQEKTEDFLLHFADSRINKLSFAI